MGELLKRYSRVVVPTEAVANKESTSFDEAEYAGDPVEREQDYNQQMINDGEHYGLDHCVLLKDWRVALFFCSFQHFLHSSQVVSCANISFVLLADESFKRFFTLWDEALLLAIAIS